jgi:hypothetical protein
MVFTQIFVGLSLRPRPSESTIASTVTNERSALGNPVRVDEPEDTLKRDMRI